MTISQIEAEARALVDTDTTSYPAATLLRRENQAYEEIISQILRCDSTWQFDDENFSTFPIGYTDLVNNQQDYSFDTTFLQIQRVQVKDSGGIWHLLDPLDKSTLDVALEEYKKNSGLPDEYDKEGKSVVLYCPPSSSSCTLSQGLQVQFQRGPYTITSADQTTGTLVPGFASPFHMLIAYKAALPYAVSYKKDRVPAIVNEINRLEKELEGFYSHREKDVVKRITIRGISFR